MPTRIALWVFLVFLALFVLTSRGHFQSTDEIAVFEQARSLCERGDVDVQMMNNAFAGREGRYYAVYGVGQSIAAAPLYALGKTVRKLIEDNAKWTATLAGPTVSSGTMFWAGEVEIFVVSLFGPICSALLCALFFWFAVQLGATVRAALIAVALFGTTTYVAGFSSTFFQHALETLAIFSSFYLLYRDAHKPSHGARLLAGLLAGFSVLVRAQTLVLLPALSAYLLWNAWCRQRFTESRTPLRFARIALECTPFNLLLCAGVASQFAVSHFKFGQWTYAGAYASLPFNVSPLTTFFGFFFSPGSSLFVFTPLLVLMPWYWPEYLRRHRAEGLCMLGVVTSYILFYGTYGFWHGQWSFGPRFFLIAVPFLMLPFALWWQSATKPLRAVAVALGAVGLYVQVLALAVNFSYVFFAEGYGDLKPEYSYLFIPEKSQLVAHTRALFAGNSLVDMWLVNVYRQLGLTQMMLAGLPLVALFVLGLWGIRHTLTARAPQRIAPACADTAGVRGA